MPQAISFFSWVRRHRRQNKSCAASNVTWEWAAQVDAKVDYYKAVSAAERSAKESKIDANTKKDVQQINYVYTTAMNNLRQSYINILGSTNGYYGYYGGYDVFHSWDSYFYQNVQIAFGNSCPSSVLFPKMRTAVMKKLTPMRQSL